MDHVTPKVDGREERGDRTAKALTDAARQIFSERGYNGASVRDIAGAAGVNPALVAYHFGSKEGLYLEVIDQAMRALRQKLSEAFGRVNGARKERAQAVVDAYLDYLRDQPEYSKLIQRALLDQDRRILNVARDYLRPFLDETYARGEAIQLGEFEHSLISLFGAIVAPLMYAPMLSDLFHLDFLAAEQLEARREHLMRLTDRWLDQMM